MFMYKKKRQNKTNHWRGLIKINEKGGKRNNINWRFSFHSVVLSFEEKHFNNDSCKDTK